MQAQLPFRTNETKFKFQGTTQLINAYMEVDGPDAKHPNAILPAPGLTEFVDIASTPMRGAIYLPDIDTAYTIHQTSAYKVTFDGTTATATRIGVVPGSDVVQISRNQADPVQITVICAEGRFYIENDVVKSVVDPDDTLTGCVSQDHIAGYTIYGLDDRRFFISALNDTSDISGLDFATAEQTPGPLRRVIADGDLFLAKSDSIEQWRDTGNADFPFEPLSPIIKKGIIGTHAATKFDNTIAFTGADSLVYRIAGTGQATRISTHGIERRIENDDDSESILNFAFSGEGHSFLGLTGTDYTRVYDAATQQWHSRESYGIDRWRARFPFRAWGRWLVGDELTGKLLELDADAYDEDGDPLVWGVDSPIMTSPTGAGIIDWIRLDMAVGYGTLPTTSQGYDPILRLSWSTDGGNTFKGNRELKLGKRGEFTTKARARRLGRFEDKGIMFRIRVSDPVVRAISSIEIGGRPMVIAK